MTQNINDNENNENTMEVTYGYPTTSHTNIPYDDRELSWLKFNTRVLELAASDNIPLLERVKFLSIASSNLDEFFSIRVASRLHGDDGSETEFTNLDVRTIIKKCNELSANIDTVYFNLVKLLKVNNIIIHHSSIIDADNDGAEFTHNKISKYFENNIKPSLAPLVLDSTRPLPHIKPFCIYVACIIKTTDNIERIGLIEIPTQLERMVKFKYGWYFIEDIIISKINQLYPGLQCSEIIAFRLLRDGDMVEQVDDAGYVDSMIKHVRNRVLHNTPIRLEVYGKDNNKIIKLLQSSLKIQKKLIQKSTARLKMGDIMQIYASCDDVLNKYPPFKPYKLSVGDNESFMDLIDDKDYIFHHPYESFNDTVLRLVKEACNDPQVISIKQTLYRSGTDSKILKHLMRAAETGKHVIVVIELKARFDEETNIEWAEKLQRVGATVVYGYESIKTHAKLIHISRKKGNNIVEYAHIGTGNYSEKNSKIYTDFSYFTSNKKICADVNNVFNMLTGGFISSEVAFNRLKVSPLDIRPTIYSLIDDEINRVGGGYIAIKVNNLSDHSLIQKLYDASNAGVKIDIICRGSCSLVAGVVGYSENITVRSIVGRFLEHSRVLQFGKDENARIFITSSDMMTRNLDRRLEILFEIKPTKIRKHLITYLDIMKSDNFNSSKMLNDGSYYKDKTITSDVIDSHIQLIHMYSNRDDI